MDVEGAVLTEEARVTAAGTGEGADPWAGECEWSTEMDYRSYAAEELRELMRANGVRG